MVIVEVPLPVIEVGLKVTVTPLGWPLADKVTAESNPPVVVLVMVEVPLEPWATETAVGLAERLKPLLELEMVTATPAEGMPLAIAYRVLVPVAIVEGTSKLAETTALPVAKPIVLKLCVLA